MVAYVSHIYFQLKSTVLVMQKVWHVFLFLLQRLHFSVKVKMSTIISRGAPIIGSAIRNARYRPNFRLSDSDRIAELEH